MARVITITSGKGGVGKTTSSVNLGAAINQFGKDVIIVDANLATPNVGLHLGAPIVPISLNHVLNNKAKVSDAIYEHESGTKIIPSSLSIRELRDLNHSRLKDVSKKLKKLGDFIILDSAAGLGEEAIAALESADEVIIVTNPEIPAVTDALKTSKLAEQLGKTVLGVVVTRVDKSNKAQMPVSNIEDMLELPVLGVIPEDKNVPRAVVMKDALVHTHPKSKASRAYRTLAAKLIGKTDYKESYSFWDDVRQTGGVRLAGALPGTRFDIDLEAALQGGHQVGQSVRASMLAVEVGYSLPRVLLGMRKIGRSLEDITGLQI